MMLLHSITSENLGTDLEAHVNSQTHPTLAVTSHMCRHGSSQRMDLSLAWKIAIMAC
jgi:hypothetical protein